jgi:prepilin-type N-terminal cleavage/methylation domain-containing protein
MKRFTSTTRRRGGFTLLELSMAVGILSIVAVLLFAAMASSASAVSTSEARRRAHTSVRDVTQVIQAELELAGKDDDPAVGLTGLQVNNAGQPSIVFQVPLDQTGDNWSTPITYRYVNEDANNNGILDAGEDTDANGVLTRHIERVQDANDDGDTDDPGEVRVLGAANDLSNVAFARNNDQVTVTVTASVAFGRGMQNQTQAAITKAVYLLN